MRALSGHYHGDEKQYLVPTPVACELCGGAGTAVWQVELKPEPLRGLFASAAAATTTPRKQLFVMSCKRCMPMTRYGKCVATPGDVFEADRRHLQLKYAGLLDAMRRDMEAVQANSFLRQIYQNIVTLGVRLTKRDLAQAWSALNAYHQRQHVVAAQKLKQAQQQLARDGAANLL
jgi:hypothetical protein